MPTVQTDCQVMKTADKCLPGIYSILWDSIRYVPGKPIYSIGRPAFDKAVINLPEEKTFSIVVKNNEKKNKYIESVTLNGQPLNTPFFHHQDIANGGTMEIKMTAQPTKWGVR